MSEILEKHFFRTFEIKTEERSYCRKGYCNRKPAAVKFSDNNICRNCKNGRFYTLPEINYGHLIQLEDIFAPEDMNEGGFYQGFHVHFYSYPPYWAYQLCYRKGGYYANGVGMTRIEAMLHQLIMIMEDKDVDFDEKEYIKKRVQIVFEVA